MKQNSFVVPKKHFTISIKFWLLKQYVLLGQKNVLSGQQKNFCCINFFLSVSNISSTPAAQYDEFTDKKIRNI